MAEAIVDDVHPSRKFYVYIIWRPDGRPCYVGKGKGSRWRVHFKDSHNRYLRNIIVKYGSEMAASRVFVDTEPESYELEEFLVSLIGRRPDGPLVNQSAGGDGASSGRKQSAEEIQKRYRALIAAGVMDKLRVANLARGPASEETRAKMSAAQKARIAKRTAAGISHRHTPSAAETARRKESLRRAWREGRHSGITKKFWSEKDRERQRELANRRWKNRTAGRRSGG